MRYFLWCMLLAGIACQSTQKSEAQHAHAPDGSHIASTIVRPSQDTTIWTEQAELFVEYPALVVNHNSRFAAHFTLLQDHLPLSEGIVTVSLIKDNQGIRHTIEQPSAPGIFNPILRPKEAGHYRMFFDVESSLFKERFDLGTVEVFLNTEAAAQKLGLVEDEEGISFLKEQAWKIPFQTFRVRQGEIHDLIHTSGQWMAAPGDFQTISANADGLVSFAQTSLTIGSPVKKNQLLLNISSAGLTDGNLKAEIQKAQADFDLAKAEYERNQKLYQAKIVPRSVFEKVENRYKQAQTSLATLSKGYSSAGKYIRTPLDGFIKSIEVGNGSFVKQGDILMTIGADRSRLLKVVVSPSDATKLEDIHDIWYLSQSQQWKSMQATKGKIQSIGRELSPASPMLPVYAQINDDIGFPEGSFVEVQIQVGQAQNALQVPNEALLENYGQYAVMVQLSGETFERRSIQIGRKNADFVEVLSGLQTGEYVVSRGAYQVKMASMSAQVPAHGHSH
ncbi:MAG: efflux RND transporter periplasmic adaptor subunit [Bacteroidia bacterium]